MSWPAVANLAGLAWVVVAEVGLFAFGAFYLGSANRHGAHERPYRIFRGAAAILMAVFLFALSTLYFVG